LTGYYTNYLKSFIKDIDGVLEHIPEDQHHLYYDTVKYDSFVLYLKDVAKHRNTLLVNTVEKRIVPYLADCSVGSVGGHGYRVYEEPQFRFVNDNTYLQVTVNSNMYMNKHNFNRSIEKINLHKSRTDCYVFCAKTNKFIDATPEYDYSARFST